VLVVEDHYDTCDLMVRLLRGSYDVVTAECYESALRAAETHVPHVVVADVGLPGRSGLELMRELKQRYGVFGVAVTGHQLEDGPQYRDAGFVKFLRKPIRVEDLLKALHEACAGTKAC
jgi:CheY-like chemotaxis protein